MVSQKSKPNNEREHLKIEIFLSIIQLVGKHNRLEIKPQKPKQLILYLLFNSMT